MSLKPYEDKFVRGILELFAQAGVRCSLLHQLGEPYRPLIKGSPNSEAEGALEVCGLGIIFVEIDKKDYASDTVVKYHRALSLDCLTVDIKGKEIALVQAFVTKHMKPLRVKNAMHMGTLLLRDFGLSYMSAESEDEDIPALLNKLREPLLSFAQRAGNLPQRTEQSGDKSILALSWTSRVNSSLKLSAILLALPV
jgi:hypothetical protein